MKVHISHERITKNWWCLQWHTFNLTALSLLCSGWWLFRNQWNSFFTTNTIINCICTCLTMSNGCGLNVTTTATIFYIYVYNKSVHINQLMLRNCSDRYNQNAAIHLTVHLACRCDDCRIRYEIVKLKCIKPDLWRDRRMRFNICIDENDMMCGGRRVLSHQQLQQIWPERNNTAGGWMMVLDGVGWRWMALDGVFR